VALRSDTEDDIALIRRAAGGDRDAFERVVVRHQASVYRFIRTLTSDLSRAEDALQETFLSAWTSARGFRGESSATTWLFTIARHAIERQFRRHAGEPAPADRVALDALGIAAGWGRTRDPEQALLKHEESAIVRRAIEGLNAADRRVLLLRDLEGLDGEEAAAVLGIGIAALKSRLHRARLRFAARLREEVGVGR
jgi:RNA polymerase sigma-70 factor (ECF subfamily)